MIIVPKKIKGMSPDIVPIEVRIQNRADLLALTLRILRYFFQCNFLGYQWHDDAEKSTIYIEDANQENPEVENPRPSLILDIGGAGFQHTSTGNNLSNYDLDRATKYADQATTFQIEVTGRSKAEAFKLTDGLGTLLFLMDSDLKKFTPDIKQLHNIQMGNVTPLNSVGSRGDSVTLFSSNITFQLDYTLNFKLVPLAPLFTTAIFEAKAENSSISKEEQISVPIGNQIIIPESV